MAYGCQVAVLLCVVIGLSMIYSGSSRRHTTILQHPSIQSTRAGCLGRIRAPSSGNFIADTHVQNSIPRIHTPKRHNDIHAYVRYNLSHES
eukprot:1387352-Amorphochlora_amoeboformis.AAC.2